MSSSKHVLTLKETAKLLRVSQNELISLIKKEYLPGRKVGTKWRFSRNAIEKWLGQNSSVHPLQRKIQELEVLLDIEKGEPKRLREKIQKIRKYARTPDRKIISRFERAFVNAKHNNLHDCFLCKSFRKNNGEWVGANSIIPYFTVASVDSGLCPECLPKYQADMANSSKKLSNKRGQ